jgi:hypothetical protein
LKKNEYENLIVFVSYRLLKSYMSIYVVLSNNGVLDPEDPFPTGGGRAGGGERLPFGDEYGSGGIFFLLICVY